MKLSLRNVPLPEKGSDDHRRLLRAFNNMREGNRPKDIPFFRRVFEIEGDDWQYSWTTFDRKYMEGEDSEKGYIYKALC